jgi:hypothetical protein
VQIISLALLVVTAMSMHEVSSRATVLVTRCRRRPFHDKVQLRSFDRNMAM